MPNLSMWKRDICSQRRFLMLYLIASTSAWLGTLTICDAGISPTTAPAAIRAFPAQEALEQIRSAGDSDRSTV